MAKTTSQFSTPDYGAPGVPKNREGIADHPNCPPRNLQQDLTTHSQENQRLVNSLLDELISNRVAAQDLGNFLNNPAQNQTASSIVSNNTF